MKIALLANLKDNAPIWDGMSADQWDDLDSPTTIQHILNALHDGGHQAQFFEANIAPPFNLIDKLIDYQPDLCFNIAEGHCGIGREAQIPAVLEMLRIPYTGSQMLSLAIALDKPMTKRLLVYHDLPTPEFQVFEDPNDPIDADLLDDARRELRFPMFVKPSREGTGMGVDAACIVTTEAELREQVRRQILRYQQPILCERYIRGREITVGVLGDYAPTASRRLNDRSALDAEPAGLQFFPPLEIDTEAYGDSEAGLYTNRVKVELVDTFYYHCPAHLSEAQVQELNALTAAVFKVLGCKDVARVDFRLDEDNNNKPYILEVNPLPGLNPYYSDLCIEARAMGWDYTRLINAIVDQAAMRCNLSGMLEAAV